MHSRFPILLALILWSASFARAQTEPSAIEVQVVDLQATPFGFVSLALQAQESKQVLFMSVGMAEGEAIARALHHEKAGRPMTHDLLKAFLDRNGWEVRKVLIRDYQDGSFRADMTLQKGDETQVYDCRPSDAIAVGLLYNAKVYVNPDVADMMRGSAQQQSAPPSAEPPSQPGTSQPEPSQPGGLHL